MAELIAWLLTVLIAWSIITILAAVSRKLAASESIVGRVAGS